ncbi:MAG TPA: NUDIX hydrolase [Chloroflexia bacterium]|nr:NUDIX hydrolase [Chloroflexia bacterium]
MAIKPEVGLSKETVYDGKLIKVIKEKVRIYNGKERPREIVVHPGAVALVVVDNDGKLILVRQYRRAAGSVLLEIPAGTREPNEGAEACAIRETQEETGYLPRKVERLSGFYSAPGFCTEFLECYLLTDLVDSKLDADDDENIEIVRLTPDEAVAAIRTGEICDAKSICGILLYRNLPGRK